MGAAASQPYAPAAEMFINGIPTETLDVCLACEKDGYNDRPRNTSEIKRHIRQFMRSVRNVDQYVIFRWSTWDTEDADIVIPTEDLVVARRQNVANRYRMPQKRAFDAIFCLGCPFGVISDKSFRTMCALLKPYGLVVAVADAPNVHEAIGMRPEPFGDCSEDLYFGRRFRLDQVHETTTAGKHFRVWQKRLVD